MEEETEILEVEDLTFSSKRAEEQLLGIFIMDEETAVHISQSGLRDTHFLKRKNRFLYPILLNVRSVRGTINSDLVIDECEKQVIPSTGQSVLDFIGGIATIHNMCQACGPTDFKIADSYISIIFEQFRLSEIKKTARWLANVKAFDEVKIVDKIAAMQNVLADDSLKKYGLVGIDSLVVDAIGRYADRKNNPQLHLGLKTGFWYMDKYRAVAKKRTTVVGAKTSHGKTVMLSNMITEMILDDKYVLLFTPELDKDEYIDRMLCSRAGVSLDAWKEVRINSEETIKIGKAEHEFLLKGNKLFIEDRGTQTYGFILSSIRRHMLNHPVDVVVVDYLQKLKYYGTDTRKAITDVMGNLYAFAKDNNIALIIASQLRRTDKADPELNDLKESGDIENFSDCVILLRRHSLTNISEKTKGYYKIAKNRQGSTTDAIELKYFDEYLKFEEVSPPPVSGIDNTYTSDPEKEEDYDPEEG